MGGAVLGGGGGAYIPRYGRGCFEILEVLFRDMGGAEICFGRRGFKTCRNGGLVVSVEPVECLARVWVRPMQFY